LSKNPCQICTLLIVSVLQRASRVVEFGNVTAGVRFRGAAVFSEQNLMNRFLAYTLLVLFSAIILSACLLIIICPEILLEYQSRAIHFPDHPRGTGRMTIS